MSDLRLLAPISSCYYTDYETLQETYQLSEGVLVEVYKSANKVRAVYKEYDITLSGLLIEQTSKLGWTIDQVFTESNKRRQGFAKSLLAVLRFKYKNIAQSDYLTRDGELFANQKG